MCVGSDDDNSNHNKNHNNDDDRKNNHTNNKDKNQNNKNKNEKNNNYLAHKTLTDVNGSIWVAASTLDSESKSESSNPKSFFAWDAGM